MKKILFPTDFSETADNAFLYTLHLAKSYDAEIYVVHAFDAPVLSSLHGGQPEQVKNVYTTMELGEFEHFQKEGEKLRNIAEKHQLSDIKISYIFEAGHLISVLKNLSQKENFDLIVMGTNGASGLNKKLWGSNTINTMNELSIPILSVPYSANFKEFKNIGFSTIFKDSDKEILKNIITVASYWGGKVKVLHIIEYGGNIEKKEIQTAEKITEWTAEFGSDNVEFIILKADNVKKGVLEFIENEEIDTLVIAKRNLGFIDSIFYSSLSKDLADEIKIPLCVVKEK